MTCTAKDEHGVLDVWETVPIVTLISTGSVVVQIISLCGLLCRLFRESLSVGGTVLGKVVHPKPVILTRTVHDLVELVLVVLLLLAASTLLGIADEVALPLAVLLVGRGRSRLVVRARLVLGEAGVDDIFSVGVHVGELEHMPGSDVALPPDVVDEVLVVYTYNEGVDDIGFQDVVELVLALGEASDAVTQAFVRLAFAPRSSHAKLGLV